MGDLQVFPDSGTVVFGSTLHGWGFSLTAFSRMYATKLKFDKKQAYKFRREYFRK